MSNIVSKKSHSPDDLLDEPIGIGTPELEGDHLSALNIYQKDQIGIFAKQFSGRTSFKDILKDEHGVDINNPEKCKELIDKHIDNLIIRAKNILSNPKDKIYPNIESLCEMYQEFSEFSPEMKQALAISLLKELRPLSCITLTAPISPPPADGRESPKYMYEIIKAQEKKNLQSESEKITKKTRVMGG